ncbi:hypothetical protein C1O33_11795 [Staphylococcus schleiferi]|uniref:hypothetical protein n=1 Tax=Staphylococcus sp. 191 TaxID=2070016 RepID=UPI0013F4AC77|nr:hypothetical protein [Staphylococcus sp. 191]NHA37404.1 hypothetical protein [Staphylococcus schleiferi]NHB70572.1 hypothetical protein [Staphylococcus sp. 191]
MKIKDLKIGDRVRVTTDVYKYRVDDKWEEEPIGHTGKVVQKFVDRSVMLLLEDHSLEIITDADDWEFVR